jgi:hypothetical protein
MTNTKLPAYFKEYLDERFGSVIEQIALVKCDIKEVKTSVDDLKKNMDVIRPAVRRNKARLDKLVVVLGALVLIILLHVGLQEGSSMIKALVGLL